MEKQNPPPYAPQPGFVPPSMPMSSPPQQQVIVNTAFVPLGPTPASLTCPHCQAQIRTTVKIKPNTKTHLFALLLCLFGCICCCCIPYCVDSCQSKIHTCPNCRAFIGEYNS